MRKARKLFVQLVLLFTMAMLMFAEDVQAVKQNPYEINASCNDLSDEFIKNQEKADLMANRYINELTKRSTQMDEARYSVDGLNAEGYPDYYAGRYINTEGKLVVQITSEYYSDDIKAQKWYDELVSFMGDDDFICHKANNSYSKLINTISDIVLESGREKLKNKGVIDYKAEIDDYGNKIVVYAPEKDIPYLKEYLDESICSIKCDEYTTEDVVGVYPGEGATTSSLGTATFSLGCRARRHMPNGPYEYGFITTAHAFSGSSNVYLPTYNGFTNIGYCQSNLQKRTSRVDAAFVSTNSNATLYTTIYLDTTTLYTTYVESVGTQGGAIKKRGDTTQVTSGIIQSISYNDTAANLVDYIKTNANAGPGDCGGILYSNPNVSNYAYSLGITKAMVKNSNNTFAYSLFCKFKYILNELTISNITVSLY